MRRSTKLVPLVLVALSLGMMPAAHAQTAQVTCRDADGNTVLNIRANAHAARGLRKMAQMTSVAQSRLGVECDVTTGEAIRVRHKVRVVCENGAGDVLTRVRADKRAMKGLETSVKAFMRVAGGRLHLHCSVVGD